MMDRNNKATIALAITVKPNRLIWLPLLVIKIIRGRITLKQAGPTPTKPLTNRSELGIAQLALTRPQDRPCRPAR